MDNLQNSRRQSFLGLSQANKNISILSEYSSNTQSHFKKSNNRISSKFLDYKTNLGKTNDFRNLNTIPFAKTRYSQLYFNNRSFYGRQKGINDATTGFKENTKEKSSNEKLPYSQSDVDDILIKFLESEKDKTNDGNIYRDKLLEESLNNSVLYSQTDIDAVLKAFLNSKKTCDDSPSNECIKNLPFSEKCNSSDVPNVSSNQNISTKEDIPSDSPLNNVIIPQTTDPENFVTEICKELLDSKTRMKKHKSDIIHIFDYSENILSKNILEEFLSSNRWDLIKHPYVMNFIDNRMIKKHESLSDFLLIYLNLLIPFYFATILPPQIFTIFGIIEIIFYVLYLFLTLSFLLVIFCHFFVIKDYEKLKHNPEEKVKHCIESLETVEKCTFFLDIFYNFLPPKLSNILVISSGKRILHNHFDSLLQTDSMESYPPISQEFFIANGFNHTDKDTSENIEININESSNLNNSSKLEIFES